MTSSSKIPLAVEPSERMPEKTKGTISKDFKNQIPLFEDEWSKVFNGFIVLSWYYCPVPASKTIKIDSIKAVYYRKQNMNKDVLKTKDWGMALTKVWWACDAKRILRRANGPISYFNVVLDVGETTMKGFTCIRIDDLLNTIRPQLRKGVAIYDYFPF